MSQQPQQQQQQQQQQQIHPLNLNQIVQCMQLTQEYTISKDRRDAAEKNLEDQKSVHGFGVKLLQIIGPNNVPDPIKVVSAIYFKNWVKKYWCLEENIISSDDKQQIQSVLISTMLNAPSSCQSQLSETISTIATYDFMEENWNMLKPTSSGELAAKWELLGELVNRLQTNNNPSQICVVLSIIRSITSSHVGKDKNEKMVTQIKYIMKQFIRPCWIKMLKQFAQGISTSFQRSLQQRPNINIGIDAMKSVIKAIEMLILIFFDLTSVDLIEYFQDSMQEWSPIFLQMLYVNDNFNLLSNNDDRPGPIDDLQTAVMKSAGLFASCYEEESQTFLKPFIETCINLLSALDEKERYDLLVAETTNYLQVVCRQQWNKSLFDNNKLNRIVSSILIRNIRLRETDLAMYESNFEDWVLRDMEGSDFCTRRRGALELLRRLCQVWPQEISMIVQNKVSQLLQNYASNEKENFIDFDTAINLFLATTVMGETKADGATVLINGEQSFKTAQQFLNKFILPYLQNKKKAPHNIIYADCLKYTIMFRSKYNQTMFEQLLNLACSFLSINDYVTHTYAAIALDRVLSMKVAKDDNVMNGNNSGNNHNSNNSANKPDLNNERKQNNDHGIISHGAQYKYSRNLLSKQLGNVLKALFNVLTQFEDSMENEYVMRAIMKVLIRAETDSAQYVETVLVHIVKIIKRIYKNPSKPTFNHYMFEIIAACIHYTCKLNSNNVENFEKLLGPPFVQILNTATCVEFHPYVFQIMGLMLRVRNKLTPIYVELHDRLLAIDNWNSDANIIAISSMFGDFYKILCRDESNFAKFMMEKDRLGGTLGIFQFLLSRRTHDIYAFRILNSMLHYCSLNSLNPFIKPILEMVFSRLIAQKTNTLCSQFIKSLSIIIIKHNFKTLLGYCNSAQQDIFGMILYNVWLPFVRHVSNLEDRLIVTHAMILILKDDAFLGDQNLQSGASKVIESIIDVFERAPLEDKESNSYEKYLSTVEEFGSGQTFSGLIFAKPPKHNISKQLGDPRKSLVQCLMHIANRDKSFQNWMSQNVKSKYVDAFNGYARQFNAQFNIQAQQMRR